ncbi:MAG: hypothetical protein K6E98_10595 [Lachnospiraceae bacterium]|nr:hypothetical protein [Lachnospiraceae bacterium]
MSTLSSIGTSFLNNYSSTRDYSILFNSLNSSSNSVSFNMFDISGKSSTSNLSSNFYADYASIKNGSYAKLTESWYAKQKASETESVKEASAGNDYTEAISQISEAAKSIGGYSSQGGYGNVDTAGSIFDTAS